MGANLQSTYKKRQSQKRVNLTNLTHQVYTGSAPSPKDLANLASNVLGRGKTAQDLADELLNDPETSAAIDQSYGASLKDLSVEDIVTGAATNLRRSQPSPAEINSWKVAVNNGLEKDMVPLSIMLNINNDNIYQTALLSATAKWNQAQWGTNALIDGSFGQGFRSDRERYQTITSEIGPVDGLSNWDEADAVMQSYTTTALQQLIGTPVSKSGFF